VTEPEGPPLVVITDDVAVQQRAERLARELGVVLLPFRSLSSCVLPDEAGAVLIELGLDGALDAIAELKSLHPDLAVVGVLTRPAPDLWVEAERQGADLVLTHGTLSRRMPSFLAERADHRPRTHRLRVADVKDLDGRLGYLARVEVPGAEDVAVYRVGYGYHAVSDRCPHAGAALHEGTLEGTVLTCPRHGSQFDVTTGQRVRGPADEPLRTYAIVTEQGSVFLEYEASSSPD
jgi:nitrite reductase/ring-hydroxylating ferredoxin subunit